MCVPSKLGDVTGMNWEVQTVEGQGLPKTVTMMLPCGVHQRRIFRLTAQSTLSSGVLAVTLLRELGQRTRSVGAFQIAFDVAAWNLGQPSGEGEDRFAVAIPNPRKIALFDGANHWVPEVVLPNNISISVFLLDRRFGANWAGDNPLIGLVFPNSYCRFTPWRIALWRLIAYLDMIRGVS